MSKNYAVGDILYLVSNKQRQVLPLQVEEQINRRTLKGESVTYRVRLAGAEKAVEISSLDSHGTIYSTLQDVRNKLYETAQRAIEEVVADAESIANGHFGISQDEPAEVFSSLAQDESAPVTAECQEVPIGVGSVKKKIARTSVVLPDGTRANLV